MQLARVILSLTFSLLLMTAGAPQHAMAESCACQAMAADTVFARAVPEAVASADIAIAPDTCLELNTFSADGAWAEVTAATGERGWLAAAVLSCTRQQNVQVIAQAAADGVCTQIATSAVNVRRSGSLDAEILTIIQPSETATYLDDQGDWIEIQMENGLTGWTSSQFFLCTGAPQTGSVSQPIEVEDAQSDVASADEIEDDTEATSSVAQCRTVADIGGLHVRQDPSLEAEIVGRLSGDAVATALTLDESGDWRSLALADGTQGWAATEYLDCSEGAGSETVTGATEADGTTDVLAATDTANGTGNLCVFAYPDQNANRLYDADVDGTPIPVAFTVRGGNVAMTPAADLGCFTLPTGNHIIDLATRADQVPDSEGSWLVSIPADNQTQIWIALNAAQFDHVIQVTPEAASDDNTTVDNTIDLSLSDYRNAIPTEWWPYVIGGAVVVAIASLAGIVVLIRRRREQAVADAA